MNVNGVNKAAYGSRMVPRSQAANKPDVQNSILELQKLIAERTGKKVPVQSRPVQEKKAAPVKQESALIQFLSRAEKAFFNGLNSLIETDGDVSSAEETVPVQKPEPKKSKPKVALGRNIDIRA